MVIGAGSLPNLTIPKKISELNGGAHSGLCMCCTLSLELNHSTMAGQLTFSCLEAAVFSSLVQKEHSAADPHGPHTPPATLGKIFWILQLQLDFCHV